MVSGLTFQVCSFSFLSSLSCSLFFVSADDCFFLNSLSSSLIPVPFNCCERTNYKHNTTLIITTTLHRTTHCIHMYTCTCMDGSNKHGALNVHVKERSVMRSAYVLVDAHKLYTSCIISSIQAINKQSCQPVSIRIQSVQVFRSFHCIYYLFVISPLLYGKFLSL